MKKTVNKKKPAIKKKKDDGDIPIRQVKVGAGRPSKYNSTIPERAKKMAKAGARDEDLAKAFGIAPSTLNEWKKKYPEFSETLKGSKEVVDKKVVCSLLKNALGYTVSETKRFFRPLFDGKGDPVIGSDGKQVKALVREEITEKEIAPSTTAQIFWLKNRQPDKWRDAYRLQDAEYLKGEVTDLLNQMKKGDAQT